MKQAHLIKVKVFSYENSNDDGSLILKKFLQLFPFDIKEEKIDLIKSAAEGFQEKKIVIYEAALKKDKHINAFLENLAKHIDERQKKLILEQKESRLDNDFNFFLRFDKDELIKNDKLVLTDSGNCFHIKISIAAFPKKREIAFEIVDMIFGKDL